MSSHHIVREHQEPALVIWSGLDLLSTEIIDGLLEWSPLILVHAQMLQMAIRKGIKVDIVLGSESEIVACKEELEKQQPFERIITSESDDEIDSLMSYLNGRGVWQANVIIDVFNKAPFFLRDKLEFVFYAQGNRGIILAPDRTFQKWLMPGQHFFTNPEVNIKVEAPPYGIDQVIHSRIYSTTTTGIHSFYNPSTNPVILWQQVI